MDRDVKRQIIVILMGVGSYFLLLGLAVYHL